MEIKDWISSVASVCAMILGVYNFMLARAAGKVVLRVVPRSYSTHEGDHGKETYFFDSENFNGGNRGGPPDGLAFDIVNLSKFSVLVSEVGFRLRGTKGRIAIPSPFVMDDGQWPRKLEPRQRVQVTFLLSDLLASSNARKITKAYASTVCGGVSYGTSGALKGLIKNIAAG